MRQPAPARVTPPARTESLRAFARRLGVSLPAVQRAIADGRITAAVRWGRGWTITDADKAKAEYEANSRPRSDRKSVHGPQDGAERPAPATLAAATLRERLARAKLIELDYERKRRALVPLREMDLYLSTMIVAVRTAILGVTSRLKQRLPHLTLADLSVVEELLREALEGLAEGESARGIFSIPRERSEQ